MVTVAEVAVGVGEPVRVCSVEEVEEAFLGGKEALVGKDSSRMGEIRVGEVGGRRRGVGIAEEERVGEVAKGTEEVNGERDEKDVLALLMAAI